MDEKLVKMKREKKDEEERKKEKKDKEERKIEIKLTGILDRSELRRSSANRRK